MNFKFQTGPHIRINNNVTKWMLHVIIALSMPMLAALLIFGIDYLLVLITSLVSILGFEYLMNKVMKRENSLGDLSAIVTAIIYSLTLPPIIPLWVVIIGAFFAIVVGKMIFGGLGANIFNPAGIGRIVVLIAFGGVVSYGIDGVTTATPLTLFAGNYDVNLFVEHSKFSLFSGTYAGSFGEVSSVALIFSAIYLMIFKVADWRKVFFTIFTFTFMAIIYAVRKDLSADFVIFHLLTGSILFGAIFMVTDPITSPVNPPGGILYAICIGALTFIIRVIGSAYPEGMVFAILIMNIFTPIIDYHKWASPRINKKWLIINATAFIAFTIIIFFVASGGSL